MPVSCSAWCQARAVLTSAKVRTASQSSKRGSAMCTGVIPGPGIRGPKTARIRRNTPISMPRQAALVEPNPKLFQLHLVDRCRGPGQQVDAGCRLREGDHIANRLGTAEPLHDPVDAVGDATVRWGPVAQRLEQEAEA